MDDLRNTESDAGRRPGGISRGKAQAGMQCTVWEPKGDWLPAYGGGMGQAASMVPDSDGDTDAD